MQTKKIKLKGNYFIGALFFFIIGFCGCNDPDEQYYIFIGHCYQWDDPNHGRVDKRIEQINLDTFDQIWLGGDLVQNMFMKPNTLHYVDSIFNIGSKNTLWAIGNHDILNMTDQYQSIEKITKRKTFHSTYNNGLTISTINTTGFYFHEYQPTTFECNELDQQYQMLEKVADTITTASHFILLHHHALLNNELTNGSIDIQKIFNFYAPNYQVACHPKGNFVEIIYPLLQKIQEKGIQVIVIGGDTGQQVKEFAFQTSDQIIFLGSGLNNSAGKEGRPVYFNQSPDKVLIFRHSPKNRKLEWEFRYLHDMNGSK